MFIIFQAEKPKYYFDSFDPRYEDQLSGRNTAGSLQELFDGVRDADGPLTLPGRRLWGIELRGRAVMRSFVLQKLPAAFLRREERETLAR